MLSKDELIKISNCNDDLSRYEKMGKISAEKRGVTYYGKLIKMFPKHYIIFCRIANTKNSGFSKTVEGFIEFLVCVGDIPPENKKPVIKRIRDTDPYMPGNIVWVDLSETVKRFKTDTMATRNKNDMVQTIIKSCEGKLYITNDLLRVLEYFNFASFERGVTKLGFKIELDSMGYYIKC